MSERLVLVDSSAWIGYLNGRKLPQVRSIEKLLSDHQAAINSVIRAELLTGAKDEKQYAELENSFEGLHEFELIDPVWRRAERMRFELRRKGHLVPLPDVLIACCAIVYDCELLHVDRDFDRIVHISDLKIHRS